MRKNEQYDPIKITISTELYGFLRQDARTFEVYRNGRDQFVMNHILSPIIAGYYERYRESISGQYRRMQALLCTYIGDSQKLDDAIKKLIEDKAQDESLKLEKGKTRTISIRPTIETDDIIVQINKNMQETNETQAGYYRRMLDSYTKLPMYEREKIIYYKNITVLKKACEENEEIVFSTRKKKGMQRVLPYKVVHGMDERCNYLLCQKYDERKKKLVAASFRISRIVNPRETYIYGQIDVGIKHYLEEMEKYGAQHSINEDLETCVALTEEGRDSYRNIYNDRPIYSHIEEPDSSGVSVYHFNCSLDQLFFYFRRFNPGEAIILKPEKLKQRLYDFHCEHIRDLDQQLNNEETIIHTNDSDLGDNDA